jgi:hypothetical protein
MAGLRRAFKQKNITPWQERIAEAVVILMLCVQPLYFNENRYIGLTGHKYNFFFTCMLVILCAVVLVLIAKLIGRHKLVTLKNLSIADWAVLGFALVTLVSALFSPYRDVVDVWNGLPERHDGAFTQLFYVLIFLIVAHWYKPHVRDFGIFGVSAIAIGLIGIFQFYGMDFFKLWPNEPGSGYEVENFYNIYFRSTLGNINIVATYVCVAILLCGFLYVKMEASKWRYVWLAGSASCFWLMIISSSESGMVGVIVVLVLAIPFIIGSLKYLGKILILGSSWLGVYTMQKLLYDVRILETKFATGRFFALTTVLLAFGLALVLLKRKNTDDSEKPVKWKLGTALMVVVIVVGIAGVETFGRNSENWRPVYQAREILHGRAETEFGSHRIYIWQNALEAFPSDNPVIGSGPDTFWQAFPNQAETVTAYGIRFDKAHNEYLQILICQGILGLLCYLVFLSYLFAKAVPKAFKNPLMMAVLAGFAGYLVQGFFNISLPIASQMLWVMAGILASLGVDKTKKV